MFGNCNIADGLNPVGIRTRGDGTVVGGFLKKAANGRLFCISSGGRLNPILAATLSPRPDLCSDWGLVWGKISLIGFTTWPLLSAWFSIASSVLGLGLGLDGGAQHVVIPMLFPSKPFISPGENTETSRYKKNNNKNICKDRRKYGYLFGGIMIYFEMFWMIGKWMKN